MASDKIGSEDIFKDDLFEKQKNSAKDFSTEINKLTVLLEGLTSVLSKNKQILEGSKVDSAKGIKQLNQVLQESKTARQGVSAVQRQLNNLEDEAVKGKIRFNQANKRQRQELTDLIALEKKEGDTLNTLAARNRQLRRERAELNIKTVEGQKRIKEINTELDKNNKLIRENSDALKKQRLNVGNYTSALGKVGNALKNFAGAFGITTGLVGLVSVFRSSIRIFRDFESAQTDVAAILQVTRKEIEALSEQAKELGATTFFTATEVSKLQIELAKLGFSKDQIKDSTEGVIDLAAAFNIDLAQAAKVVAGTLNGFVLEASESGRVADVLAKAFGRSALDIEKFEVAISKVAPIAKGLNVDIETTTAVLGQLVNANFDASTAGTQFRNILLKLSNPASELANTLGFTVNSSDDLIESFSKLNEEQLSVAEAQGLIDVRSVALLKNLSDNIDKVKELRTELDAAGGTAQQIAQERLKTLDGNLRLLTSAYEGFVLSIEDGDGALGRLLKQVIQITTGVFNLLTGTDKARESFSELSPEVQEVATQIFNVIVALKQVLKLAFDFRGVIIKTVIALKAYTLGVKLSRLEMFKLGNQFKITTIATKAYQLATKLASVASKLFRFQLKAAKIEMKALNATIRANPLGLLLSILTLVVAELIEFVFLTEEANDNLDEQNENLKKTTKSYAEYKRELAVTTFQIEKAKEVTDLYASALGLADRSLQQFGNQAIISGLTKATRKLAEEEKRRAEDSINFDADKIVALEKIIAALREELKIRGVDLPGAGAKETGILNDLRQKLKAAREARDLALNEDDIEKQNKLIKEYQEEIKRLENLGEILSEVAKLRIDLNKKVLQSERDLQKVLKETAKLVREGLGQFETIEDADGATFGFRKGLQTINKELKDNKKNLEDFLDVIERREKLVETQGKGLFFRRREISKESFDQLLEDLNKRSELIQGSIIEEFEVRKELLFAEKQDAEKDIKLRRKLRDDDIEKEKIRIEKLIEEGKVLKKEEEEFIRDISTLRSNSDQQEFAERTKLQQEFDNNIEKLNQEKNDSLKAQDEKLAKDQEKLEFNRLDLIKDRLLKEIDVYSNYVNQILALTEQKIQRQNELEEQQAQREVDFRERNADRQLNLAVKGIDAQYKFEEERAAQARANQLKLEQRNRRQEEAIRLTSAFFSAFDARLSEAVVNANLKEKGLPAESGVTSANAAAFAVKDVFLAEAFSQVFGGNFATGVENFQGRGTETSDSNIIGFSHGESVVTAKGTRENKGLVTAMNEGNVDEYFRRIWLPKFDIDNNPKILVSNNKSNAQSYDVLVKKMDEFIQVTSSRPVQQVDVDGFGNIIETTYKNGVKSVVRHKRKSFI